MIAVSSFVPLLLMLSGGPMGHAAAVAAGALALVLPAPLPGMNYIAVLGHVIG